MNSKFFHKVFDNTAHYLTGVALVWLVVTVLLYICGLRWTIVLFTSATILWLAILFLIVWIFATDGRKAWVESKSMAARMGIRVLLVIYASCIIFIMGLTMSRLLELVI